jgi:hypothetical protein
MNETHYLVDNNALIAIGAKRARSSFFVKWCHVTADVIQEAEEHPFVGELERLALPRTARTLEIVRAVMSTEKVGDTSLVDLYKNLGAADPGLIAAVLEIQAQDLGTFLPDIWKIVSNDKGVKRKAGEHDIDVLQASQLANLIDADPMRDTDQ